MSGWPSVRLDAVAKVVRGVTYAKGDVIQAPANGDIPVLRAGNINGHLILDDDLVWLSKSLVNQDQILRRNDIVMCMSSGSASIVGKSALLDRNWIGSFGAFCAAVRSNTAKAEPGFLAHVFQGAGFRKWASAAQGNNIKNLNKSALEGYTFPLPPLDEQRRIVELLDRAAEIRRRADAARGKARTIIPALFLDTFGDPATNPKGWRVSALGKYADVQGGVQVSTKRATLPVELPYLRVANVMRGSLNLSEIKMIRVTVVEAQRTSLVQGDVLVVEGHGNPNEIGRAAVWDGSIAVCTHQNHLIRARPDRSCLTPEYLETFLNSDIGRRILIQNGKTTSGLNTISTRNVKDVAIPLPPLALQTTFSEQVQRLESLARHLDSAAAKAEAMAAALSAEIFR